MPAVAPPVNHLQQITQYDCWHAALRMMLKWRDGAAAEPQGTHTDWLYLRCREAQNGYQHERQTALAGIANPTPVEQYNASRTAKIAVENWARTRRLGGAAGYRPFESASRPGLTIALLPMILGENRLRAVRGAALTEELGASSDAIGTMLTTHGPLYCLLGFGHVVVVTGIDGENLTVCDPLLPAPNTQGIGAVANSPAVARLA
ncbi:papain-like cysteine protease family protein [Piscinibacter sakaiensis]|uniref:papain-like cysteine protease family protein n=1 Tax=Piscinibacter sakaiensis TaxID=1547922 RepID=UPI003AAB9917